MPAWPTASRRYCITSTPKASASTAIEFHPSWHALMQGIAARGYHSSPWAAELRARPGAHAARAAGYLMQAQIESGTLCPTTMTYGAIAAMRRDARLALEWVPRLLAREYDARDIPFEAKRGGLIGMGMTEKQGGSDVRANTTRAVRSADGSYRITGHKWFFSAPQCDAHLVLAQTDRRTVVLFHAAALARRDPQRHLYSAAERQARQSLERLLGSGVRRCVGVAPRRRGARRSDHPRDGNLHAPGLRRRHGRHDAPGRGPGFASRAVIARCSDHC